MSAICDIKGLGEREIPQGFAGADDNVSQIGAKAIWDVPSERCVDEARIAAVEAERIEGHHREVVPPVGETFEHIGGRLGSGDVNFAGEVSCIRSVIYSVTGQIGDRTAIRVFGGSGPGQCGGHRWARRRHRDGGIHLNGKGREGRAAAADAGCNDDMSGRALIRGDWSTTQSAGARVKRDPRGLPRYGKFDAGAARRNRGLE